MSTAQTPRERLAGLLTGFEHALFTLCKLDDDDDTPEPQLRAAVSDVRTARAALNAALDTLCEAKE